MSLPTFEAEHYRPILQQTSILIIGQGLCGTWLGHYLEQAGIPFLIMDEGKNNSASQIASGIINPVTGRRLVKTWMIDDVMPFAAQSYNQFGEYAKPVSVIDFFSAPDVEVAFNKRLEEKAEYLSPIKEKDAWRHYFHFDFGAGAIEPCFLIDVKSFLQNRREHWQRKEVFIQERFEENELKFTEEGIFCGDIEAQTIIYCDGIAAANSKYFNRLPFAPNKGEALIVEIPDLPAGHIYKKGMSLVPWKPGEFWVGSTYQWKFENDLPTQTFRENAENWLKSFCKMPFEIVDHLAAVRPATIERRPFIGLHPLFKNIGIFNGMGTKGVSLAPYFAQQFATYLLGESTLLPDVDIKRFEKVLSR